MIRLTLMLALAAATFAAAFAADAPKPEAPAKMTEAQFQHMRALQAEAQLLDERVRQAKQALDAEQKALATEMCGAIPLADCRIDMDRREVSRISAKVEPKK